MLLISALAAAVTPTPPPVVPPPSMPADTVVDVATPVLAALLAAGLVQLAALRRARPAPRLVRVGRGAGFRPFGEALPGTGDGPSVWVGPDPGLLAESLAARLGTRGPVLLLTPPHRRSAVWGRLGVSTLPVYLPEEERPSARRALAAAAPLGADGATTAIVVEGASAMEPVPGGRPSAALEELIRASTLPVFVVVGRGEEAPAGRWPVVRAARVDDATWSAEGVPLVRRAGLLERA